MDSFFNPRLREGGDFKFIFKFFFKWFSIHASAKEATLFGQSLFLLLSVFNPRLREGGDTICSFCFGSNFDFQSTPPRRRRPFSFSNFPIFQIFSIHASAKEATHTCPACTCSNLIFNPRLREGGDWLAHYFELVEEFFNPRLREGGDSYDFGDITYNYFSIHASAKEATIIRLKRTKKIFFQSTPPRRRRLIIGDFRLW